MKNIYGSGNAKRQLLVYTLPFYLFNMHITSVVKGAVNLTYIRICEMDYLRQSRTVRILICSTLLYYGEVLRELSDQQQIGCRCCYVSGLALPVSRTLFVLSV